MARYEKPLQIPEGLQVRQEGGQMQLSANKRTMSYRPPVGVQVAVADDAVVVTAEAIGKGAAMMAGTTRARLRNIFIGLSSGFERRLILQGVGYRATMAGKTLQLTLGFSHPVELKVPEGMSVEAPSQTEIVIRGHDKQAIGQFAANVRAIRPLEPYKGKGVRYADEPVVLKSAKKKVG